MIVSQDGVRLITLADWEDQVGEGGLRADVVVGVRLHVLDYTRHELDWLLVG